jgi:ribosome biogenesis GTPase
VITVLRGACEVVAGERVQRLRLSGSNARTELDLAVGDRVRFDPVRGQLVDTLPRRTKLARLRSYRPGREQVIAANADRLAIVTSVTSPPFKSGAVDRFLLAARAGKLESLLVVNKIDLLEGRELPDEIRGYQRVVPIFAVCAQTGEGCESLGLALASGITVFAGQSGVGKSSLLNALEPELRLETGEVSAKWDRGRHTTTRSTYLRLRGGGVVIDTPGVREIGTGPVDRDLLGAVYPEIVLAAVDCRFRDCQHASEPGCAVLAAVEKGEIPAARVASYQRLLAETR